MAYENETYDEIIARMVERIKTSYPNIDDREGSILFNAQAAAAAELAIVYIALDNALQESMFTTASRDPLLTACQSLGINIQQFEASAGTFKGEFNVPVEIGSRWGCDVYNYEVIEYLGMNENDRYEYSLLCDTVGAGANNLTGSLSAITDYPNGLEYAEIVSCIIQGEDETSDDAIREYYQNYLTDNATDCNVAQYRQWCNSYNGIGNYKIFPLWNGTNTVKISILNSSNGLASDGLIDAFQEYLDPNSTGMGDGVAPIGAIVTVTTATEVPINISANIAFTTGYSDTSLITAAINSYFAEIAYATDTTTVSYMSIGSRILAVEGVINVTGLLVNGGTTDITLGGEQIPALGTANWTVT